MNSGNIIVQWLPLEVLSDPPGQGNKSIRSFSGNKSALLKRINKRPA